MESVRRNILNGLINEAEYRDKAIEATIQFMDNIQYKCIRMLGEGTFGSVVELKHRTSNKRYAVKIVLKEKASESEMRYWSSLTHENVLPLISMEYVSCAYTYVFVTPKHAGLSEMLETSTFYLEISAIDRAISWLRDVLKGLSYLHGRRFSHLDLKTGNILISDTGYAVICDFGSLTQTEEALDSYASPLIYRPPEAYISERGLKAVVNGFRYDVWTVGVLALEIFTKHRVLNSPKWVDSDPKWSDVMYSRIFDILEKKEFKKLIKATFRISELDSTTFDNITSFVQGCLSLNPGKRPTVEEALGHKLFGGTLELQRQKNDVWKKRASLNKVKFLESLFIAQASRLYLKSATAPSHGSIQEAQRTNKMTQKKRKEKHKSVNITESKVAAHEVMSNGIPAGDANSSIIGLMDNGKIQETSKLVESNKEIEIPNETNIEYDEESKEIFENDEVPLLECKAKTTLSKKQKFMQWTRQKVSGFGNLFNWFVSVFRRSR